MGTSGIQIDDDKCTGCRQCIEQCGSEALHTKSNVYTVEQSMTRFEKDRDFYESSGGGVTLSGGEILSHADFALAVAKECAKNEV